MMVRSTRIGDVSVMSFSGCTTLSSHLLNCPERESGSKHARNCVHFRNIENSP